MAPEIARQMAEQAGRAANSTAPSVNPTQSVLAPSGAGMFSDHASLDTPSVDPCLHGRPYGVGLHLTQLSFRRALHASSVRNATAGLFMGLSGVK
ncbi:hypothetical protein IG631_17581 [Alternaria alternata]|nr:hypothetical protein IG631_17581 [Alternaria alternata]